MSAHGSEGETCVPNPAEHGGQMVREVAPTDDGKVWRFGSGPLPGGLVHGFECAEEDARLEPKVDDSGTPYIRVPAHWAAPLADLIQLAGDVSSLTDRVSDLEQGG